MSLDGLLVRVHSRNSGRERLLSVSLSLTLQATITAQARTCTGLDRLLRIFAVVKYEISIITGSFSPRLGRLEAETVTKARVRPEDSAVERGALSKTGGINEGRGLASSLQVIRLYRSRIMLIMTSVANKRVCPIDL